MISNIVLGFFEFFKPFIIAALVAGAVYTYFRAQELPNQIALVDKVRTICTNQPSLCVAAPKEQLKLDAQ